MNLADLPIDFFPPETVKDLEAAFQRAWKFVKMSGDSSHLRDEAAQACLAKHVLFIARNGEKNMLLLTNLAIARFRQERKRLEATQKLAELGVTRETMLEGVIGS